jgi:hypothetical protein
MGDQVALDVNKGIADNVKESVSSFISSSKDDIMNNGVVNKGSEAINASTQIVSKAVSNISIENTKDAIMDAMSDSSSTLYFLIVLLVIAAFVCYILYYIITDTVIKQQKILIPGTEMPIVCSQYSEYPFTQKLESSNGNRRTYCFWIYIFDINSVGGVYKHVANISTKSGRTNNYEIKDSTIYIRLKSDTNSLQVRFPLVNETATFVDGINTPETNFLVNNLGAQQDKAIVTGIEIEYVPIQRWVHVGIVVNDIGGGSFNIFIDGNYVKTENNQTVSAKDNSLNNKRSHYRENSIINVSKLNMNNEGILRVGGDVSGEPAYGFSGLISKFTIFNYDMNRNDIYKEYSAGPMKGVLASLGLSAYGIRNPIYKIKGSDSLE